MSLPLRLKIIRTNLGKSQKAMAEELGKTTRSWQVYEEGKSVPGGEVFEALVKLGFDANWILTGEGEMKRGEGASEGQNQVQQIVVHEPTAESLEQDFKLIKNLVEAYEFVLKDRQVRQDGQYKALAIAFIYKECKQNPGDWTVENLIEKIRRMD